MRPLLKILPKDWFQKDLPHYGQFVLLLILWMGLSSTYREMKSSNDYTLAHQYGIRVSGSTVLSPLPEPFLLSQNAKRIFAILFAVSACLWLAQLLLPWSPCCAAISYTSYVSLKWENAMSVTHSSHIFNMIMIILAVWYCLYSQQIKSTLRDGRFWRTPLFPRWAQGLFIIHLGCYYGYSGVSKLLHSGLDWFNGVSMQRWAYMHGDHSNPLVQWVLSDSRIGLFLLLPALPIELAAFPAIFFPRLRVVVGAALILFHIGVSVLMGLNFGYNIILLITIFLPIKERIDTLALQLIKPMPVLIERPKQFWRQIYYAVVARIDVRGSKLFNRG